MRLPKAILLSICAVIPPAYGQATPKEPSVTPEQRKSVSDQKAAEVKALIAEARKRQEVIDRQNTDLWSRWTYAVCVGCGPNPKRLRVVHTHPHRVLKGVPAAEDDMRELRGIRI